MVCAGNSRIYLRQTLKIAKTISLGADNSDNQYLVAYDTKSP